MVTGLSFAVAWKDMLVGEMSRISPCSQLMVHVNAGVPGKGWPRRKRKDSVALGALCAEGVKVPCTDSRSGTSEVTVSMILFVAGSRIRTSGRWSWVLLWTEEGSRSPTTERTKSSTGFKLVDIHDSDVHEAYHDQRR